MSGERVDRARSTSTLAGVEILGRRLGEGDWAPKLARVWAPRLARVVMIPMLMLP